MKTRVSVLLVACFLCSLTAFAASGGPSMPWDEGLQALSDNMSGTVAHLVLIALVVIAGIVWAATEHSQGVRRLSQLVFGGALAVEAVSVISALGLNGAIL